MSSSTPEIPLVLTQRSVECLEIMLIQADSGMNQQVSLATNLLADML